MPAATGVPAAAGTGVPARSADVSRHRRQARAVRAVLGRTAAWSRRPAGRLVLPGLLLLVLVAMTGATGAYLVPAAAPDHAAPTEAAPSTSVQPTPGVDAAGSAAPVTGDPLSPPLPGSGSASGAPPAPTTGPAAAGGRPADALSGWAAQAGARVGIPLVAMQAYGYAELVLARTTPGCRLTWTTLAAIGRVESNHGSANGAVLGADGQSLPPIVGLPLDGQGGRMRIADTDQGRLDGDRQYDRAMGPMQFIPTTWAESGADGDGNAVNDPNDIDDAALAAGNYLCKGGRNLSTPQDWWNAILSYNDVRRYAQDVFNAANDYGLRSRT